MTTNASVKKLVYVQSLQYVTALHENNRDIGGHIEITDDLRIQQSRDIIRTLPFAEEDFYTYFFPLPPFLFTGTAYLLKRNNFIYKIVIE